MLLVIFDLDIDYAKGLMNQLKRREDFRFDIQLVTTLEHLNKVEQEITLLLLDEKLECIDIRNQIKYVLYLSEVLQDESHIKRYQSIDKIVTHIKNQIMNMGEKVHSHNMGTGGIIALYSPIGGCGQTKLATAIAQRLVDGQRNAYYFDFELVPSFSSDKSPDFYYDLQQRNLFLGGSWGTYFEKRQNINSLCTSLYNSELWNVDKEDIEYFIDGLSSREEIAYYVFDIGFLNTAMLTILKKCDYWFLPRRSGDVEEVKIENLRKLIQFREGETLESKLIEVDIQNGLKEVWRRLVL